VNMVKRDPTDHVPLSDLSFHILLALGQVSLHGYAIGKEVECRSQGRLNPTTGSLYQALRRLQRDGLIREAQRPAPDEERDARRQYFSLTEFGRDVFALEAKRLDDLLSVARDVQLMPDRRERPETA